MWRRLLTSQLKTLTTAAAGISATSTSSCRYTIRFTSANCSLISGPSLFNRHISVDAAASGSVKKKVEDVMPIATGHEREELEAELEGKDILDVNYPVGPFGTKEAPAVVKSYYDRRIVGCPGGEDEDEHDVVWFWLEKGKPLECPVCSQYFQLEVVGPGGDPEAGHGDHHH